jgi:hypothetical protein
MFEVRSFSPASFTCPPEPPTATVFRNLRTNRFVRRRVTAVGCIRHTGKFGNAAQTDRGGVHGHAARAEHPQDRDDTSPAAPHPHDSTGCVLSRVLDWIKPLTAWTVSGYGQICRESCLSMSVLQPSSNATLDGPKMTLPQRNNTLLASSPSRKLAEFAVAEAISA